MIELITRIKERLAIKISIDEAKLTNNTGNLFFECTSYEEEIKTMFVLMMESYTIDGEKVNSALDGLIEKVGMFAMEKKSISVNQVKENFSINEGQAENVIKQLETIGLLGGKNEDGTHTVMMDKDAFINSVRGYQDIAGRILIILIQKKMKFLQ